MEEILKDFVCGTIAGVYLCASGHPFE